MALSYPKVSVICHLYLDSFKDPWLLLPFYNMQMPFYQGHLYIHKQDNFVFAITIGVSSKVLLIEFWWLQNKTKVTNDLDQIKFSGLLTKIQRKPKE